MTASTGFSFTAQVLKPTTPTTADGIERYLASGQMPGIGPAMAKQIVAAFGEPRSTPALHGADAWQKACGARRAKEGGRHRGQRGSDEAEMDEAVGVVGDGAIASHHYQCARPCGSPALSCDMEAEAALLAFGTRLSKHLFGLGNPRIVFSEGEERWNTSP
jgi:hypothetical protein